MFLCSVLAFCFTFFHVCFHFWDFLGGNDGRKRQRREEDPERERERERERELIWAIFIALLVFFKLIFKCVKIVFRPPFYSLFVR